MNTVPNAVMINRHVLPRNPSVASGILQMVRQWSERASQRRALAALDDRALQDIGLSRATALGEANKPFWRT